MEKEQMNFFKFEDKVKNWIEDKRHKWILLLFTLGIGLGVLENYLLGGGLESGFIICSVYSIILVSCELFIGGSGIEQ